MKLRGFGCSLLLQLMILFGNYLIEVTSQNESYVIVQTQYGEIMGNRQTYEGKFYEEYLGIPYAEPPVDYLRWKKPQPVVPWEPELWNGTEYSICCTQLISVIYPFIRMGGKSGEDCLYLNIWVPQGVSDNEGQKLPVMVWIYGGFFMIGTGEMYPGYGLALHGNVIVVNFNFRVSTLGFLSTGDTAIPGNYGLWDTKAALEWIRDNIHSFNGDPDQVTIFGQSAGGSMVSHSMISSQTNQLFKSAISVSGSASRDWGLSPQPLRTSMLIAEILNCSATSTKEIRSCLLRVGPHTLDFWGLVGASLYENRSAEIAPVIDGDFVVRHPLDSFQLGEGKHINFITGSGYHDAAGHILNNPICFPPLNQEEYNVAETNESLINYLYGSLSNVVNADEIILMIYGMYPDLNTNDTMTRTLEVTKAATDSYYASGSNWEAVQHQRAGGPGLTFQYQFHHRQSFLVGYPSWVNGSHMDDIYSFLGPPYFDVYRQLYLREDFNETDLAISESIMDYYSNFAHTGNPNVGPHPIGLEWTQFTEYEQNFLQQSPTFSMGSFYNDNEIDRYRFWMDLPNYFQRPPDPTFPESETFSKLTEEEINLGVDRLKQTYWRLTKGDPEVWMELEKYIDGFVEDRRLGFPINS